MASSLQLSNGHMLQRSLQCSRRGLAFKPATSRQSLRVAMSKGFGADAKPAKQDSSKDETTQQDAAAASSSMSTLDILEARVKSSKRRGRVEPKVAVNSPIVDQTTGKVPATPEAQTETAFVSALLFLFVAILIEGLALAGAGFLPEEIDAFIQDAIYPSFSPTVLAFLGASSLYGLWKTGKLPGQQQTLDK